MFRVVYKHISVGVNGTGTPTTRLVQVQSARMLLDDAYSHAVLLVPAVMFRLVYKPRNGGVEIVVMVVHDDTAGCCVQGWMLGVNRKEHGLTHPTLVSTSGTRLLTSRPPKPKDQSKSRDERGAFGFARLHRYLS
jgi:hypothetical protein